MKRTKLYKDITTESIYTFAELKNGYETANDCEIEIDDDSMEQIIHENLWSCGGNIQVISDNDKVLKWCNDYAERMEADRCMTAEEIDDSNRENYYIIINRENVEEIIDNLYWEENEDDAELYHRLLKFLGKQLLTVRGNQNFLIPFIV